MAKNTDPTEAMREAARGYDGVTEGESCSQSSFKAGKTAFFYVGPQGGRFKAMFKLDKSMADAEAMAEQQPDSFEVGKNGWVTARFSAEKPMGVRLWKKWLKESYTLSAKR